MSPYASFESGYVIHSREYKESSLLVDFFTLNQGRVSAIARSAKSVKSRKKAALQPFVPLRLNLKKGRGDLYILEGCKALELCDDIKLPNLFCAMYINELLFYLYKINESDADLFAKYIECLNSIRQSLNIEQSLRDFEYALLESLGYGIVFTDDNGNNFEDNKYYMYIGAKGFVETSRRMNAYSGDTLYKIKTRDFDTKEVRDANKHITSTALSLLLGNKEIKSKAMYLDFIRFTGSN